jgi:hypothetical protein
MRREAEKEMAEEAIEETIPNLKILAAIELLALNFTRDLETELLVPEPTIDAIIVDPLLRFTPSN